MTNERKVSQHLICYIDVLGYKDKINTDENTFLKKVDKLITRAKETADRTMSFLKYRNGKEYGIKTHVFSDNIIFLICTEHMKKEEIEYCLFHLVYQIALLQDLSLYEDILLRGSIVHGNIYYEPGSYVFGTGLVTAYDLENHSAIYPRVVIEKALVTEYMTDSKLNEEYIDNIVEDFDGVSFVNYFNYATKGLGKKQDDKGNYATMCQGGQNIHNLKIVNEGIDKNAMIPSVLQKYKWIEYHMEHSGTKFP